MVLKDVKVQKDLKTKGVRYLTPFLICTLCLQII